MTDRPRRGSLAGVQIGWAALTVDAQDPRALAAWWAQTLGGELDGSSPDGVEVRAGAGSPSLFFMPVGHAKPAAKNRLHLDLSAEDPAAAIDDLLARGAARADVGQPADAPHAVLRDPEGNEFCVLHPPASAG